MIIYLSDPKNSTRELSQLINSFNKVSWDLMKLQSFCKSKDTVKKTKQQPTDWQRIFANSTSDRGLLYNIYKELRKLDYRELNNPRKMGYRAKQKILS